MEKNLENMSETELKTAADELLAAASPEPKKPARRKKAEAAEAPAAEERLRTSS